MRNMTARDSSNASPPVIFVDSDVLIAAHDARNEMLARAAQAWVAWCWRRRVGRISTQVLNEFYNGAVKAFGLTESSAITPADVRTSVRRLRAWQPPHLDRYAVDGAWDLQDRHGLSYWNALIVSSALQQSCTHLLSLELAALVADGEIEGIRLVSPLAMKPEELE
jgi:predicted nucleic acid-binding protein